MQDLDLGIKILLPHWPMWRWQVFTQWNFSHGCNFSCLGGCNPKYIRFSSGWVLQVLLTIAEAENIIFFIQAFYYWNYSSSFLLFLGKGFLYQSQILSPFKFSFAYIFDQPPRESLERILFFFVAYLDKIPKRLDRRYYVGDFMFSIEFRMMLLFECHIAHDLVDITTNKQGLWFRKTGEMAFQYFWWFLCTSKI